MLGKSLIQAAAVKAGAAGGLGIEDVFSTWLHTGNGATQTITNGIDLAGEGGLVWCKSRSDATLHELVDTARGVRKRLDSASTAAEVANADLESFNSDGFRLGFHTGGANFTGSTYASWTFRKAPGFFDAVSYTGNGSNRTISHNLGSVPGAIIVKRTDTAADWQVYHRSLANTEYMVLNSTAAKATGATRWNSTTPTSSVFSLGTDTTVNASGGTYVAYLFAHDEQIFGEGGDQSVIKCGSYTGNGSTSGPVIDLGWEPQWVLIKATSTTSSWLLYDVMRGWTDGGPDNALYPNLSNAEDTTNSNLIKPLATGFQLTASYAGNFNGISYVYIAIRRGPMKTPTSGTEVFEAITRTSTGPNLFATALPYVDAAFNRIRSATGQTIASTRFTGLGYLQTALTNAEASAPSGNIQYDFNNRINPYYWQISQSEVNWLFRRAPGFFDVVAYTGTNTLNNVPHNLDAIPELLIIKNRTSSVANWIVYSAAVGNDKVLLLNSDINAVVVPVFNNTTPTSSVFTLQGDNLSANRAGNNFIAYLFATLPGVSKVFSFTGNGTNQTIDCGFAAGARFVLLKRTDSAGSWLVADTARGIVSGNDPLLYLNSTAAEITTLDWIDPHSSGFIVNQEATANANVGGATYIGLAIA